MAEKSFQKKKVRLYAAALSFLIVAFSFCPILEVFASDLSGTGSPGLWTTNAVTGSVSCGQVSALVPENTDVITYKVPLYLDIPNDLNNKFAVGHIFFSNPFTFKCAGNDILPSYFESVESPNVTLKSGTFYVLFNGDFLRLNNQLLGYFVFYVPISNANQSFIVNISGSYSLTLNCRLFLSSSYQNLVYNIAYAINNSTDIQEIIDELYLIRNNAVLLADVVDNLENINGILGNIYNYMVTMNATQLNSMRQLVYALSGVDLSTTSASALSQATYNRWVQLIYDAINYQGPDSSAADQAADNLEDAHEANDVAQDSAYQAADTAMQNVNFNVTVPNGLTNAALTIGNYITSIYGQLGSDLQFLITATLTIGLITVILGVINRYPKNTYTTESETVSTGERNGKKFSSSYKTTTKRTRHR